MGILSSMCSSAKTWPFRPSRSRANLGNHLSPIQGMQDSWPFYPSLKFTNSQNLLTKRVTILNSPSQKKHTNLQNCQDVICWKTKVSKVRQVTKWPYNHCHSPGLRPEAWLDVHVSNESSVFFLCMLYANSMMVLEIENVLLELVYLESRLNLLPREHHPYQSTKHTKSYCKQRARPIAHEWSLFLSHVRQISVSQYPTNNETATKEWICNFSVMQNSKTPWGVDQDARMQTLDKSFGV